MGGRYRLMRETGARGGLWRMGNGTMQRACVVQPPMAIRLRAARGRLLGDTRAFLGPYDHRWPLHAHVFLLRLS